MDRTFFVLGSVFALLGVAAGAFAAHALKGHLTPHQLDIWETGARYHLYQSLGLLAVAWAATRWPGTPVNLAGWLFVSGVLLFSGSLYLLAVTDVKALGAITPLGGLCFLMGWASLAFGAWRGSPPV
jgi:uncharacterized membrane protein YgdD (TMEM256/DUF423 family)